MGLTQNDQQSFDYQTFLTTFGLKESQESEFDYEKFIQTFFGLQQSNNLRQDIGGSVQIVDSTKN